jgi:hypothetical protein
MAAADCSRKDSDGIRRMFSLPREAQYSRALTASKPIFISASRYCGSKVTSSFQQFHGRTNVMRQ